MATILSTARKAASPEEIAEMGNVIYDSGKRLEHLVENFLIYAQIELLATDRSGRNASCRELLDRVADHGRRAAHHDRTP